MLRFSHLAYDVVTGGDVADGIVGDRIGDRGRQIQSQEAVEARLAVYVQTASGSFVLDFLMFRHPLFALSYLRPSICPNSCPKVSVTSC